MACGCDRCDCQQYGHAWWASLTPEQQARWKPVTKPQDAD